MQTHQQVLLAEAAKPQKIPTSVDRMPFSDGVIRDSIAPDDLELLFYHLPIEAIWIRTQGAPKQINDQHFFYGRGSDSFSSEVLDYLASERWLKTVFLPLRVCSLDLDLPTWPDWHTYICAYYPENSEQEDVISRESGLRGYWLFWTRQPLTEMQKYCIEQKVHLLKIRQQKNVLQSGLNDEIKMLRRSLYKTEHQLRTPLSLVELYANILHRSLSIDPLKEQAQYICKTVDEINLSLKRLVSWEAAPDELHRSQCDLHQVVNESIEELGPYLKQRSITISGERESLLLTIDAWQIKQVFKNLLSNAIAFSPEGSTISCDWQIFQDKVLIEIRDQGPGFSSEDLKNLFTLFYTRRQNGTGLGLVIARDLVQAHQGQLWAKNRPSGGAILSIALPRK